MKRIPHFTTLIRFSKRVSKSLLNNLLDYCVEFSKPKSLKLAVDATGFELDRGSEHYAKIKLLDVKKKKVIQLTACATTGTQLITSIRVEKRKSVVNKNFIDVVDCYDIGLWNQLALIKKCDVFLSPHTGFAFLAPCVGTPWLAISGGDWSEYLFNRIPFYSILPDVKDYPRHASKISLKIKATDKLPEMKPNKLDMRIPEIIKGIKLLLSSNFTYKKAIKLHVKNIKESRTIKTAYGSFDNVLGFNK